MLPCNESPYPCKQARSSTTREQYTNIERWVTKAPRNRLVSPILCLLENRIDRERGHAEDKTGRILGLHTEI